MVFTVFQTLVPDFPAALRLASFMLCGVAIGWTLRKSLLALAALICPPEKTVATGKVIAGTLLETVARTAIFFCTVLGLIAFGKYSAHIDALSAEAAGTLERLFYIALTCTVIVFLWNLIRLPLALIQRYSAPDNKSAATLLPLISALLKLFLVGIGTLTIIRVTTNTQPTEILTMLGIGGLAIGLASQDTVKNFFGSVMLILDRPFQVGDTIDIGDDQVGRVEEVGVRSTRIRARDGSVFCIPNGDLANRTVRTVTARETIRDEIVLNLSYSTSPEDLEKGVEILRELLDDPRCVSSGGNAPRIYFGNFGASSLDVTAVYHFASSDYAAFLRFKHALNLAILRRFNAAGLEFAYPTQTVYLKQEVQ